MLLLNQLGKKPPYCFTPTIPEEKITLASTCNLAVLEDGNFEDMQPFCDVLFWQGNCPQENAQVTEEVLQEQYEFVKPLHGEPKALFLLAHMYITGKWVKKNDDKAVGYLLKASELDNEDALKSLNTLYLNGRGINEKTSSSVLEFLTQRARNKCPKALYRLGLMYQKQKFVKTTNPETAELLFKEAADLGHTLSAFELAKIFEKKPIPPKLSLERLTTNYPKSAEEYYKMAADAGHGKSACKLVRMYVKNWNPNASIYDTISTIKTFHRDIIHYYNNATVAGDNDVDEAHLASFFLRIAIGYTVPSAPFPDFVSSLYRTAADLGNTEAAFVYASRLDESQIGKACDNALTYYKKAAKEGHQKSIVQVALNESYKKANAGDTGAMYGYAMHFLNLSNPTSAQKERAINYLKRAAAMDHLNALKMLNNLVKEQSKTASSFMKSYYEANAASYSKRATELGATQATTAHEEL